MTPTGLEQQICFALYAASRAVTGLYRPVLAELGLTYPQYVVMLVLWQRGELSVGELGEALDLDSGTLSPLLKRLQAQGLVERRRSASDERAVLVSPTPAGAALRERAAELPARLARAVGLRADEADQLHRLLERVREAADAHNI
jgi:DNA-binding MarR family transcriptional regulator